MHRNNLNNRGWFWSHVKRAFIMLYPVCSTMTDWKTSVISVPYNDTSTPEWDLHTDWQKISKTVQTMASMYIWLFTWPDNRSKLSCSKMKIPTALWPRVWEHKEWPKIWTLSLATPVSKEENNPSKHFYIPNQPHKQRHLESNPELYKNCRRETANRRTRWLQDDK